MSEEEIKDVMDRINAHLKICSMCDDINNLSDCNADVCINNLGMKNCFAEYRRIKEEGN